MAQVGGLDEDEPAELLLGSAKGPSAVSTLPLCTRTVAAVLTDCRAFEAT